MIETLAQEKLEIEDYSQIFKANNIEDLWINYSRPLFEKNWVWTAKLTYRYKDYKGEKHFKGQTLQEVMEKIKAFVQSNEITDYK